MIWSLQTAPDLSEDQFQRWSNLLEERAGIYLNCNQKSLLQAQVSMRMREIGQEDYTQYYELVVDGVSGALEWSILVDRLVVKETNFFRHKPSSNFVRQLLQSRIDNNTLDDAFDVWSVGCSTGEEPYSLAMLINESFKLANLDSYFGVTATDISKVALSVAKKGVYSQRKMNFVPGVLRNRYFRIQEKNCYKVSDELRDKICFTQANILRLGDSPKIKFDVIFCQNVLVYFKKWLRHQVLDVLAERLKPGGVLIVGMGEVVDWNNSQVSKMSHDQVQAYISC